MPDNPNKKIEKLYSVHDAVKISNDFYIGAHGALNSEYIPRWEGESDETYRLRLSMTPFPNVFAPIVLGLSGLITKKEPTPQNMDEVDFDDVDLQKNSLGVFVREVCLASLISGIEFVAVQNSVTKNKTYFKRYPYSSLMSYYVEEEKLQQIVFREEFEVKDGDYGLKKQERFVVFKQNGGEVWWSEDGKNLAMQEEWSNTLNEVPVASFVTGKEISKFEVIPQLYDIVLLNKVLVNLETHLGNVLSVVGNPVPIFYGQIGDNGVQIGVRNAFVFSDKAKEGFEYVEVKGQSIDKLENKIKSVNEEIDKLAFSLLQKTDSRTVIDAKESQSKNTSFMSQVAIELENKVNNLYDWKFRLENSKLKETQSIEFKKDFDDVLYSDSQLDLLYKLVMSGDLSRETLWKKLLLMKALPDDFDATLEKEMLETEEANMPNPKYKEKDEDDEDEETKETKEPE